MGFQRGGIPPMRSAERRWIEVGIGICLKRGSGVFPVESMGVEPT